MENKKMPLDFLAGAVHAAKNEMLNLYQNSSAVQATKNFTVFKHEQQYLVMHGNLHDQVDAPYCIEFDLIFRSGNVAVQSQRNYF